MNKTFEDLQSAIIEVLESANSLAYNGLYHKVGDWPLKMLQAEFNVHFREPDEEQLKIL
jgi:hypothetical protein|tara:strand:+ start:1408 stop:1584 length:177 start_codon:yes stop_codon:yes gene_type:complete